MPNVAVTMRSMKLLRKQNFWQGRINASLARCHQNFQGYPLQFRSNAEA